MTHSIATEEQLDYSAFVRALLKPGDVMLSEMSPREAELLHMGILCVGEAAELADQIKKHTIYRKPLDRTNVVEELGDLEFSMEAIRQLTGISREETIEANKAKLLERYKSGKYSNKAAVAREDKLEPENLNACGSI